MKSGIFFVVLDQYGHPLRHLDVTLLEYIGVVLGLVPAFRINVSHECWREDESWRGRLIFFLRAGRGELCWSGYNNIKLKL
jgi:predicted membrane chloride channel (bestrophin family)